MPIKADQLREKEDYQKLIMERLQDDNGFRIRPNTAYRPGLAMDTDMLLEFLVQRIINNCYIKPMPLPLH